jgi:hypothetical protein
MLDDLDHQNLNPAESAAPAPTPAAPHPRSMKSASVNAAGRSARMAMAAMSFARRLLNGARMAPRPGAIAQSTHVWRFTKFQPAICRLRSFYGCGEPPRRNAEKSYRASSGKPLAGGLYSSLKPVLPCQAMSSVGSGSV